MRTARFVLIFLILPLAACGKKTEDDDDHVGTPSTGAAGEVTDTSREGLAAFVAAGSYTQWTARQAAVVSAVSAHRTRARTYFNDTAATALRTTQTPLPVGSVVVKELYGAGDAPLSGHAVMVKMDAGLGGATWVFYEASVPTDARPYYGKGLGVCTGCHAAGADHVLTDVP